MKTLRDLLDTSVYSQALRRKAVPEVLNRWQEMGDGLCSISIVTVAEVEWGLHKLADTATWSRYEALLKPRLKVLPTDAKVWNRFARMKAAQAQEEKPIADLDLLIGATAAAHGLIVATCNIRHFAMIEGVQAEDWSA